MLTLKDLSSFEAARALAGFINSLPRKDATFVVHLDRLTYS